jgi:hypothetical protein
MPLLQTDAVPQCSADNAKNAPNCFVARKVRSKFRDVPGKKNLF